MALITNTYGDNPQMPSITSELYIPDQLIAGNLKLVTQPIVVEGNAPLPRGTILGQQTNYSVLTAAGANTGNGTVAVASVTAATLLGTYNLVATSATTFSVTDPEGVALAVADTGTAYTAEGLTFTITAGATAFAVGDSFALTVEDSVGNFILSVKTATDGSQNPSAILVDYAAPTTAQPVNAGAYVMGEFNVNAVNYDSSWTLPALQAALRTSSIFLKGAVSSAPSGTPVVNLP